MKQLVAILGATGSIGQSTLRILEQHPEIYQLYAVSGYQHIAELIDICLQFSPKIVALPQAKQQEFLQLAQQKKLTPVPELVFDEAGLIEIASATEVNVVMAAIVGAAGLQPTLAAIRAGKRVLLANKEALVMSGDIMLAEAKQHHALLLPVDSEHNAIFQCLPEQYFDYRQADKTPQLGVAQILLTASGGPFLNFTQEQLDCVTPVQACKHPNWSMGRKISVDSATLMNKGLELIEACHLFSISEHFVTVVIHPQSIIHSMVQYIDGSTLAQMGNPDMCTPIAHALAWPKRISTHVQALNLFDIQQLDFYPPDIERFPALTLARQAMRTGGTAPAILNAANEVAVAAFLTDQISFMDITRIVADTLDKTTIALAHDLQGILQADQIARQTAKQWITQYGVQ
ncbi:1-deoxy-D-xylulose-5-phosphate reductoisomerase [Acinetobacter qingfengensis]|uniref:1-deoxy-D-xylulose 5-phosphate reductoisomerase n=1 Tax=Acinetobacter qingfengensis TaxID=1262585 RepID=A0A1E7RE93_9GAMM|nr:1-deoxy-D-xylulose-5-phosphate reductoisomerase [Acinetobacter qingfengensis]KAA8734388.1 1-deoxy-D-xylulose-5-phosphate reductoisomerase [Acinetobacter qingfengensis]OEY97603.1 1-deoxy-D-xylulose-5-phosphate reductoisomerase [Acinetobacter qingfengensis]